MARVYRIEDWPKKKAHPARGRFYEFAARELLKKFDFNIPIPVLQVGEEDSGIYTFDHFLSELPPDDRAYLKLPYARLKSDNDWQGHSRLRNLKRNSINKASTNLERMQADGLETYRLNILETGRSVILVRPQDAIAQLEIGAKLQTYMNALMTQAEHSYQGMDQSKMSKREIQGINTLLKAIATFHNNTMDKFFEVDIKVREVASRFYKRPT